LVIIMNDAADGKGHGNGSTVKVTVFAPGLVEGREFTFRKDLTVGQAAAEAAAALGFHANAPSFQKDGEPVLDRTKTLAAAGVRDGDVLELVDAGGGV
jgi:WXG100 protein secretion system (Wss), protein YukD